MKSQLFASAAFVLLSAVPGALSAEEAKLQGAVAVTSFEDQLADFFDEREVSEDEDNMDLWRKVWTTAKTRKGCSRSLLDDCEDARRAVRRGRRVRSRGRSFSSFRDLCSDACDVRIPRSSHRRRDRDYSGKSEKDDRDYSGKSEKDDRDYSGKSEKDEGKGGKSDKSDFFYDKVASEDEDFILTESGEGHHDCVYVGNGMWACGGRRRRRGGHWGKSGRGWRPKSDKVASEDEDFILTESGKGHHTVWWGSKGQRIWYGKSGHRVVWHGPKSDKVASEDEGYDSV